MQQRSAHIVHKPSSRALRYTLTHVDSYIASGVAQTAGAMDTDVESCEMATCTLSSSCNNFSHIELVLYTVGLGRVAIFPSALQTSISKRP